MCILVHLRALHSDVKFDVVSVLGKAKLTPHSEPTVTELELCAAVLAAKIAELICEELNLRLDVVRFFCDSKIVLGYIYNKTKHFYMYLHKKVQRIHQSTKPEQ